MYNLTKIQQPEFDAEFYIAYATNDNFTGKALYKQPICLLHEDAAAKLKQAILYAKELGLRFKIFDAYRPLEIQQKLWDDYPNPHFISNPETGSVPHCRGVAIDLTIIDNLGQELDMGTKFDEFTPLSHHGNIEISKEAQRNRHLLMGIMTTAGWDFYRNEWWHYQLFKPREYKIIKDVEAKTGLCYE